MLWLLLKFLGRLAKFTTMYIAVIVVFLIADHTVIKDAENIGDHLLWLLTGKGEFD